MRAGVRRPLPWVVAGVALLGISGWYLASRSGAPESGAASASRVGDGKAPASNLPCHQVLKCAAAQAVQEAGTACRSPIEQLAVYAPRWTQRAGEPIFNDYAWHNEKQGSITFFGNRAEFQNASGGFGTVAYECDWDPRTHQVLEARAKAAGI